jgi:NAD(P)-dependent dehydrogenase (short-subunit alcohol dehydrogenase family)
MFKDKAAIVTGGGAGIGRAVAKRLLEEGASVVLAEADDEAGREAESELAALGPVRHLLTDVSSEPAVAGMIAETVRLFGGLDLLVNNAAISNAGGGPVADLALEAWNRVLAVNLTGPFLCAKHAAPHLRRRRGSIVNLASTRAFMSEPNTEAYAASKGGVVALTHALAVSLGPEVRVNVISPGWIETGDWQKSSRRRTPSHTEADRLQHPAGRVGVPADIADAVVFLAGAGFVTGANLMVDGGMTRKMIYV